MKGNNRRILAETRGITEELTQRRWDAESAEKN